MTDTIDPNRMPSMDEVYRFLRSNPIMSFQMFVEVLSLGSDETDGPSGGRFRELWQLAGGAVDRKGNAWVEMQVLPQVLRNIIDADAQIKRAGEQRLTSHES